MAEGWSVGGKLWWRYEVLGKGYGVGGMRCGGLEVCGGIWVCGRGFSGRVTSALNF